jgi:HK97 family phage major capsid protein
MSNEKALLEKRGNLLKQMEEITATANTEKRALSTEESGTFDKAYAEFEQLNKSIEQVRKLEEIRGLSQDRILSEAEKSKQSTSQVEERKAKEKQMFRKFMLSGEKGLNEEERTMLGDLATRAQSVGTTTAGGFLVPEGFSYELDVALKAYGGVRSVARVIPTSTGNDIPFPNMNDTGNAGRLLTENTQITETAIVFGSTTLKSYMFSSDLVLVSAQLMQDSAINVEQIIAEIFAERIGRITNTYYTTGTGTNEPMGVVTAAATTGVSNAAAAAISFDDIINLKYGLDPAYRNKATFMLNDSTEKAIVKLSIGTDYDQPLWQASYREGQPDTILGHKYVVNQAMASIGASAKSMLFGDFSKYIVRDVSGVLFNRMAERYADYFQVGFVMGKRESGHYIGVSGAQAAIKVLQHAAS